MINNTAVTAVMIMKMDALKVLEVVPSLAMDTSSMDSEINTLRRIVDAKNVTKIANRTNAKISILSAKKRKSATRKRTNAASLNAKIIAAMIITALAVEAKNSMSRTFLILRTKAALYPSLIR
jgi:hypothetical protein